MRTLRSKLGILNVEDMYSLNKSKLAYKFVNNMLPKAYTQIEGIKNPNVKGRFSCSPYFKCIKNEKLRKNLVLWQADRFYKTLPASIRKKSTLKTFTVATKKHLLNKRLYFSRYEFLLPQLLEHHQHSQLL